MVTNEIRDRYNELSQALRNARVEASRFPVTLEGEPSDTFDIEPRDGRMTVWENHCQVSHTPEVTKGPRRCRRFPYDNPAWAKDAVKFYISCLGNT